MKKCIMQRNKYLDDLGLDIKEYGGNYIYTEETEILEYREWSKEEDGIKNGLTVVYEGEWLE